jgi:hypothetical protein
MKHLTSLRTGVSLGCGALLLAACGGGGGGNAGPADPTVAGSDVPLSATTSSAGAFAFVKSVAAARDDTATPLVVGDAVLATSETDEPDPGV